MRLFVRSTTSDHLPVEKTPSNKPRTACEARTRETKECGMLKVGPLTTPQRSDGGHLGWSESDISCRPELPPRQPRASSCCSRVDFGSRALSSIIAFARIL